MSFAIYGTPPTPNQSIRDQESCERTKKVVGRTTKAVERTVKVVGRTVKVVGRTVKAVGELKNVLKRIRKVWRSEFKAPIDIDPWSTIIRGGALAMTFVR